MKKSPDATPSTTTNAAPQPPAQKEIVPDGVPTTYQLAIIAATLARTTNDAPDDLADTAMQIWMAAWFRIVKSQAWKPPEDSLINIFAAPEKFKKCYPYFSPLDKYPVLRDRFLCVVFPQHKARPHELASLAKGFIRHELQEANGIAPTQDEVDAGFGAWPPCNNYSAANGLAIRLATWHSLHISTVRRDARSKRKPKSNSTKAKSGQIVQNKASPRS